MRAGVRSGVADIGWCFQGYSPEMTPLSDVIALPGLPIPSAQEGHEVLWKLSKNSGHKEGIFQSIRSSYTGNPYFLLTSKKQVKTLDDLKGMKIRVTGAGPTQTDESTQRDTDALPNT